MNKELIELQNGCQATCVVILEAYYRELGQGLIMDANMDDTNLFARNLGDPVFKEKLEATAKGKDLTYFVIRGISEISEELQNRYVGLVKDREFGGYKLPDHVTIVFTVKDRTELPKISKELYHFCVVAF